MVFCTLTKSFFLLSCFQTPNEATLKVINMWPGLVGKNARFLTGKALGRDLPWLGEESRQQITVTHVLVSDKSLSSCHPLSATPIHLTYKSYTSSHLICSIIKHCHGTEKMWAKISRTPSNTKINEKTFENICFTLCAVLISIILRANVNALFKICLTHTQTDIQAETTLKNQTYSCVFWRGCLPLCQRLRVRKCACVYHIHLNN